MEMEVYQQLEQTQDALKAANEYLGWIAEMHNTGKIDLNALPGEGNAYAILASVQNDAEAALNPSRDSGGSNG